MTAARKEIDLDPIEKAIRNAFEKGNPDDRAFRERVYRSAFAALDRALLANPNVTVEVAMKRRKSMQAKIAEIESEFLPAVQDIAPEVDLDGEMDERAPSPASHPGGRVEPSLGDDASRSRVLPVVPDIIPEGSLPPSPEERVLAGSPQVAPERDKRRIGRRLPLTAIFFGVTILALIGIGLWWALQSNAFKTGEQLGQPPVQTPTVSDEDYEPEGAPKLSGEEAQNRNWINVFSPDNPAQVATPSDARAEVMKDDSGSFLRVTSGASGSAVSFDVGQGILEQIAGKKAVFDIIARAEDGKETQMSVDCNFGELGDCGRKRYAVGNERNEYLFDVQLPSSRPGAAGTIAINSDFDKQGKSVDIYEIRVSVTE